MAERRAGCRSLARDGALRRRFRWPLAVLLVLAPLLPVGCSPAQLAPMPLGALAALVDSAQMEHAPAQEVDWLAVVAAHDAYLDHWEAWRRDGVALWSLRPLDSEQLLGAQEDGATPLAFSPWSGLLRRSHGADRRLHDDLIQRRAAHPSAVVAAMLRRRVESGILALAVETSQPIARAVTDLRTWLRLAIAGDMPGEVADLLAHHEREQKMLVDALEEALLVHLRHFTVDGEWRGDNASAAVRIDPAEPTAQPTPIPRVAWDALVRVVSITDAAVRLLHDSLITILARLDGPHRRDLMLVIAADVADPSTPDDQADLVGEDDFRAALAATAAVLAVQGEGDRHDPTAVADAALRRRLGHALEAESECALRAMLLVAWRSMATDLQAQPRMATETVPTALRHLDAEVLTAELIPIQQARQRNVLQIKGELAGAFTTERIEELVAAAGDEVAARVARRLRPAMPEGGTTGAWRDVPTPEPWRRTRVMSGAPSPTAPTNAEATIDGRSDGRSDGGDLAALTRRRLREPLARYLAADERELAAKTIHDVVESHVVALAAAIASAAAWHGASLAPGDWPDPRVVDHVAQRIESAAQRAIAEATGRVPNDPLLACLRLDWTLARLDPDRAFGTSEARRDHATPPTLLVDFAPSATQRIEIAARIVPFVPELTASAERVLATIEQVAVTTAREGFTEDDSNDAWRKRLGHVPVAQTHAGAGGDETPVPPALRASIRNAEAAMTEHAALTLAAVESALGAFAGGHADLARIAWTDAAFPIGRSGAGVPDGPALLERALASRMDLNQDPGGADAEGNRDRIVALMDAADETRRRIDRWRRDIIDAASALPFIPIGTPTIDDLRRREAALWARHRLTETHVRGALLALQHADKSATVEIRAALGLRTLP